MHHMPDFSLWYTVVYDPPPKTSTEKSPRTSWANHDQP